MTTTYKNNTNQPARLTKPIFHWTAVLWAGFVAGFIFLVLQMILV